MLRTIRYALAGRAARWLAVPTLALAAGAALVLSVSAGTVPLGFGTSVASTRGCAANGPQQPSVATTIKSLRIAQPAPLKPLPALSVGTRQPASPMTRAAKAREAQIQELKASFFPKVRTP